MRHTGNTQAAITERDIPIEGLQVACHNAMRPYPTSLLTSHLHVTLEMVTDTTADQIGPDERHGLTEHIKQHLRGAEAFQVTAGSPIANRAEVAAY
ncbi:hypothetical protein OG422_01675 [Streptomyces sp. NBC_01525]|uniref:hypothetical protein n=1 Tax=Streptomyces sp. NBC_01525 TaxID=2903893 RepID=UPI003862F6F8